MALRQLGLFQLNTNPGAQEIDFGTPTNPLDEIFASSISATTIFGDGSNLQIDGVDSLVEQLSIEESTRENADLSLATKISTDVGVAIDNLVNGAPSALDTLVELAAKIGEGTISEANIVAEINSVGNRVTAEEATRLSADGSLATLIGQVSTGMSSQLASEISQTDNEVSALTTRISTEESVRATQVSSLQDEITGEVNADINSVDTRVLGVEGDVTSVEVRLSEEEAARVDSVDSLQTVVVSEVGSIDTAINEEAIARASSDDSLSALIDAEISTRIVEVDNVDSALSSEATVRAQADSSLDSRVDALEANAYDDSSLNTRVATAEADASSLETRVSGEEVVRLSKDNSIVAVAGQLSADLFNASGSLTSRVSSEENVRAIADSSLNTKIESESATRITEDASLDAKIDSQVSTLNVTIDGVSQDVVDEAGLRAAADSSIVNKLNQEVSTLEVADSLLSSRIDSEENARQTADSALSNEISVQASMRQSADQSVVTSLNNVESALNADILSIDNQISSDVSGLTSTDVSLESRLGSLEAQSGSDNTSIDTRVSNVEDDVVSVDTRLGGLDTELSSLDSKIDSEISAEVVSRDSAIAVAVDELLGGAGPAYDTLKELETALLDNDGDIATILTNQSSLGDRVSAEESVRLSVDSTLESSITSNVNSIDTKLASMLITDSDLSVSIDNEQAARIAADGSLESRISDEEVARAQAISSLDAAAYNDSSINTRVSNVEDELASEIDSEASSRVLGDNSLNTKIGSVSTALAGEIATTNSEMTSLTTRVADEEGVRAAAVISLGAVDTSLHNRVSSEEVARGAADSSINTRALTIEGDINSIDNRVLAEESTRLAADGSLASSITSVNTRIASEESKSGSLTVRISNTEDNLTSEVVSLDTRIGNIEADAYDDTSINNRVTGEESIRLEADNSLATQIGNEVTRATSVEGSLNLAIGSVSSDLASEIASTNGDVTSLTTRVSNEESARAAADVSLQTVIGGVSTDLGSEAGIRAAADTSLTNRIATEETVRASADASLEAAILANVNDIAAHNELSGASLTGNILTVSGSNQSFTVDLSQFEDNTDNYVTGASLTGDSLVITRVSGNDITINLGQYQTSSEVASAINLAISDFLTSAQISSDIEAATSPKANQVYVDAQDASLATAISAVQSDFDSLPEDENDYVSSAAMSGNTLELTRTDGGVVSVDLSQFIDDTDTDNFVTGASITGDILTLTRQNGNVTVDLGQYQTSSEVASQIATAIAGYATEAYVGSAIAPKANITYVDAQDASLAAAISAEASSRVDAEDYVTSAVMDGNVLELTRAQGGVVTVDLSQFNDNTDNFLTGASISGDVLTLTRVSGGSVTVNLGQYQTSSEVASQITTALVGYATEGFVTSAVGIEETARISADASLEARISASEDDAASHNELNGASFAANVLTVSGSQESYTVNLASLATDVNVSSGSYDSTTGELTLTKSDGNTVVVSDFYVDVDGDNFITSATLSGQSLVLGRQGLSNLTVDLSGFVTSGELASAISPLALKSVVSSDYALKSVVSSTDTSLETRIAAVEGDIAALPEDENDYVSSAAIVGDSLRLTRTDGGVVTVDLSDFKDNTDNFLNGASISGDVLTLTRVSGGSVTVNLGQYQTSAEVASQIGSAISDFLTSAEISTDIATAIAPKANTSYVDAQDASLAAAISAEASSRIGDEDFVVSAAMDGDVLELTRAQGGVVTVDLSQFKDDTDTDNFVTGASITGDVLTLTRQNGNVSVNLGQYQTSSEVAAQITSAIAGYATESYVSTAIAPLAVASAVSTADNSLTTRIAAVEAGLDAETSSRVDSEDYVVSATMSNDTLKLTRAQGGVVTVDLSQFNDNTDNYLTGASLVGDVLSLSRVSGGSVSVNLGQYQTSSEVASQITSAIAGYATESYVDTADAAILSKITSVDTRFGGLPNEDYVSSAELSNQTLKLTRTQGGVVSVDLGTFTTSGELASAISPLALKSKVSSDYALKSVASTADSSLATRIAAVEGDIAALPEDENDYVVSATLSGNTLVLGRSGGLTNVTVDLSQFKDNTDNHVTGASLSGDVLTLSRVSGGSVTVNLGQYQTSSEVTAQITSAISGKADAVDMDAADQSLAAAISAVQDNVDAIPADTNDFVDSANVVGDELRLTRTDGAVVAVDLSQFKDNTDNHVTGASLSGNILTLSRVTGGSVSVNLGVLATDVTVTGGTYSSATQTLTLTKNNGDTIDVAGFAIDTDTDNYVDSVAFNTTNGVLTLGRTGSLTDLTVDLDGRYLVDSKDTYTTGATFNTGNGIVTFTNNDGGTYTVDLDGRFTDNAYADAMNQYVRTTDTPTFAKINTGQGATEVHLMNQNVRTSDSVTFNSVGVQVADVDTFLNVGQTQLNGESGFLTINTDVEITGELRALSKSFLIDHPTQPNMKLQYGNLEGPEHGVYVRGKVGADGVIELPEYWTELVDEDSITVQLTAIGSATTHFVESIENNQVKVGSESGDVNAFYLINAERKDIYKLKVEFPA